jgi:hypothetical protein
VPIVESESPPGRDSSMSREIRHLPCRAASGLLADLQTDLPYRVLAEVTDRIDISSSSSEKGLASFGRFAPTPIGNSA